MPRVHTESGSIYEIDHKTMTWKRVKATDRSGDIRTDGGTFYQVRDMVVGKRMFIEGPGLAFGSRWIHTSEVTKIEEDSL